MAEFNNMDLNKTSNQETKWTSFVLLNVKTKVDGEVLVGDAALAHPGEDAQPRNHHGSPSGMQRLIALLREKYGTEAQEQVTQYIDDFLDLRRGRHSLLEYLIELIIHWNK